VFGHIDVGVGGQAVSHNILVTIIAEQGAMGLIPYLLIYVLVLARSFRAYRSLPSHGLISRDYVVCVWCGIAAYVTNAMFIEMRYFEYVNVLFFFLVGAMVGMQEAQEADVVQLEGTTAGRRAPRWSARPETAGGVT
jgi:O-antigen ligase